MVSIIFHSHATTLDNEAGVASGHNDVKLSEAGIKEARDLGGKYKDDTLAAIFCSDLQRSYKTAERAFDQRFPIIKDARLRECDYGELTQKPKKIMQAQRTAHIEKPFPGGESYLQVVSRMRSFLTDLLRNYNGQTVMVIGHGGTRLGLEYWLNHASIEDALKNIHKEKNAIIYKVDELYPLRIDSQPLA